MDNVQDKEEHLYQWYLRVVKDYARVRSQRVHPEDIFVYDRLSPDGPLERFYNSPNGL